LLAYRAILPGSSSNSPNYNQRDAYNGGGLIAAHSFFTNFATVEGVIRPSASGTFAIRCIVGTGDTITVKAGSTLEYW
jgi:hypothetical protein